MEQGDIERFEAFREKEPLGKIGGCKKHEAAFLFSLLVLLLY